jgi:sugar transferase (PEP-CTERM system associated)
MIGHTVWPVAGGIVIRIFHHYVSRIAFLLFLLELMLLLLTAVLSAPMRLAPRLLQSQQLYSHALGFALVMVLSMGTLGMYQHSQSREDMKSTLLRILPALALAFGISNLFANAAPAGPFSQLGASIFLLGGATVLMARLLVFTSAQSRLMEQRLIVIGDGSTARECMALAKASVGFHPFKVVGFVPVAGETCCVPGGMLLPADLPLLTLARRYHADEIVVSVNDRRGGSFPVHQLLDCALGGVPVIDAARFFEREACQIRLDALQPSYLIFGGGFKQSPLRAMIKRSVDLLASAIIGLVTAPIMLLTALAIRLEDGGPVFYQQERVGRANRSFRVLKFRSMRSDAERDGQPRWAVLDDPRITRVGHWIRRLRIDELPQMLNVLRGEMSFVGPRPERAYFVEQLCAQSAYYNVRHSIKPGITGLAQVRYRYGASVDDAICNLLAARTEQALALNQVYNIAVAGRTSLNQLYAMLQHMLLADHPQVAELVAVYQEFRAGDVRHSHADISKASQLLHYRPTHDLQRGLQQTVHWYGQQALAEQAK